MEKTLLERLKLAEPSSLAVEVLSSATDVAMRADKENRFLELRVGFPSTFEKEDLYRVEEEIAKAHDLKCVRILPQYPSEKFTDAYFREVMTETERVGIVAKGFFSVYRFTRDGDRILVEIPFSKDGIALLEDAKTHEVMENIIFSEFGIRVTVTIEHSENFSNADYERRMREQVDKLNQSLAAASVAYDRAVASGGSSYSSDSAATASGGVDLDALPRIPSIYRDEDFTPVVEDGICRIGHAYFDISSPEPILGEAFDVEPIAIASIDHPQKSVTVIGDSFQFSSEPNRTGDKHNVSFCLSDGNSAIDVRAFSLSDEENATLTAALAKGGAVAVMGSVRHETRRDKTESPDYQIMPKYIAKIKKAGRKDKAPVKRVELHLHTNMSTMDALIPPDEAVKQANKWGHPAVAITDHGNVQGYQGAMKASEKLGQKVIYGIEAYFVNDTASAMSGRCTASPKDETIVFDIETTGLSPKNCRITEIGAVRVKNGEVIDSFDTFVNPECPIPEEITKLTSITDEMVADAPKTKEALQLFFDYIGSQNEHCLMVAHNASFDMGFIRYAAAECELPFDHPYLDTLALSRFLNPSLKNHKLDTVAEHYHLGDFNHHRACDDAEMLARIYFCLLNDMETAEITSFEKLSAEMTEKSDPLKLPTYHQIILVKNKVGLKNLYRLISFSYLQYFHKRPRIPKTELEKYREGLIIGSACEAGELFRAILDNKPENEIEEIVNFYDYLEIQPISNNRFLIAEGKAENDEDLRNLNRRIVALGEKYGKPVVATCDAHFMNDEDEIYRKILLAGQKYKDYDRDTHIYFRTTEEMLAEFAYLGEEKAYEVVVKNTNDINDQIAPDIRPFPDGTFTPSMEGAEEDLQRICFERAHAMYGNPLPEIVDKRLRKELDSIIKHGFAVLYMIAQKLVWFSESQGYLVGSRGSVGSSFVASMAGISEVNPLPPHYYCPKCQYSDFTNEGGYRSGFDMPDAFCPQCGTKMKSDGHDIPFETFLGFHGDKSPDIDLNFSGEVQGKVHKYTEELFGAENVFRAGTIGTLADKTAYGYVVKYLEDKGVSLSGAAINDIIRNCVGVKRTTGQHPGGIVVVPKEYEIYDFCPVQHPAEDPTSDIVTTHFTFEYLHDTLLKLDELGHDIPTKYKYLELYSGTSVMDVPMNAPEVYDLFLSPRNLGVSPEDIECSIGTLGLPEFGTRFVIKMLEESKPTCFADLLQISGLSHGTDVWNGNAQDLIKSGTCDIAHVIGCRDNIMNDLIRYGVESSHSFKIMEAVRKGKGLTPEFEQEMIEAGVPDWYIGSCKKIKYMFPKAHAAAYVMSAIRLAWYKVHIPLAFYCSLFTVAPNGFDAEIVSRGKKGLVDYIHDIEKRGKEASKKEQDMVPSLQLANECFARHIKFLPIDLEKSDANAFVPENGGIRMPFSALPGLGENAAANIIRAREEEPFFSVEDLQKRAGISKSVIEILRKNGVLDGINETDQLAFF